MKTTDAELPDWAKAHTPLPKDEGLQTFIDKLREEFRVRAYKEAHPEPERAGKRDF